MSRFEDLFVRRILESSGAEMRETEATVIIDILSGRFCLSIYYSNELARWLGFCRRLLSL